MTPGERCEHDEYQDICIICTPITIEEIKRTVGYMRRRHESGWPLSNAACRLSLQMSEMLIQEIERLEREV